MQSKYRMVLSFSNDYIENGERKTTLTAESVSHVSRQS
jgi:hypothetical protein